MQKMNSQKIYFSIPRNGGVAAPLFILRMMRAHENKLTSLLSGVNSFFLRHSTVLYGEAPRKEENRNVITNTKIKMRKCEDSG